MAGNTSGESSGQRLDQNEVENLLYAGFLGVFLGGRIVMFCSTISRSLWPIRCICSVLGRRHVLPRRPDWRYRGDDYFARRTKRSFFQVSDFIAPLIRLVLVPGVWATLLTVNCGAR